MVAHGIRVGELARRCGISVRTLHHWDEIGLLRPLARTPAGHRRYAADAITEIAQIRALQQLGLPLGEIRRALARRRDRIDDVVHGHAVRMRRQLETELETLEDLERVAAHLRRYPNTGGEDLARLVEYVTLSRRYFSSEQRDNLERRCHELGAERIAANRTARQEVLFELRRAFDDGARVGEPCVRHLVTRHEDLTRELTGNDAKLQAAITHLCRSEPAFRARRGVDDAFFAFLQDAWRPRAC